MNSLIKSITIRVKNNSKVQAGNTERLLQRNASICVNRFCTIMTEWPIDMERCPNCNKPMHKTIAGAYQNKFVSI
jgi:hypothetical protein